MKKKYPIACVAFSLFSFIALPSFAQSSCETVTKEIPFQQKLASAGTFANLRNSVGSLRYESKQMLTAAEAQLQKVQPPADLCPANCQASTQPAIVFISKPSKFLRTYSEAETCDKLFEKSKTTPFEYDQGKFQDLNAFSDLFSEFSQGKGDAGKDLYVKCPGACSPRYTTVIEKTSSGYTANSKVICGPARDKDDNQYDLTVSFRWLCHNN